MEIVTITLILGLLLWALALILFPLWQQSHHRHSLVAAPLPGHSLSELDARYQAALAAIKDLMFDYEMGKISHEDYNDLLVKTKAEAAKLRQQIDRITGDTAISLELDAQIEALIAHTRRAPLNHNGHRTLLMQIDRDIAQLKTSNGHCTACRHCNGRVLLSDTFCPSCGLALGSGQIRMAAQDACQKCSTPVQPSDAFCAGCGTPLDPLHAPPLEKALVM